VQPVTSPRALDDLKGLLFVPLGALLTGYGLFGDQAVYAASLGINVNLWTGLGILLFGVLMLAGGWRAMRGEKK